MNDYRNGSLGGMNSGSVVGSLTGFMIGAIVGAGVALLLAPDSGKRTRQRLGATAQKLTHAAGEKIDAAKSVVSELGSDAKAAIQAGKETFTEGRDRRTASRVGQPQYGPAEERAH